MNNVRLRPFPDHSNLTESQRKEWIKKFFVEFESGDIISSKVVTFLVVMTIIGFGLFKKEE